MPSKNPRQRLEDILANIEAIESFVSGMRAKSSSRIRRPCMPLPATLEIISEASRRLPDDLKDRHPHIDWPAVAAAGNVYRHEYEIVAPSILWRTTQRELPSLREAVRGELDAAAPN